MKTYANKMIIILLIDGRTETWFDYRTIPGAVNMPFHYFKDRSNFEFEFEHALKHFRCVS